MALTAEQIAEARREGYSDAEILQHYAQTQGIDLKAARDEGYSDSEILSHFSGSEVQPQQIKAAPEEGGAISSGVVAPLLGATAGAAYSAKTLPIKAARAVAERVIPTPAPTAPGGYTTPSGINVEQTPGGMHPGAVGNAQFNVEQQQANKLHQNLPEGYQVKGTSRIITPVGMQEPAAALGGASAAPKAIKAALPEVGGLARNIATSNPIAGALAATNLQQAINRGRAGDTTGAVIGGAGTAASLLPKMKGKAGLIKPIIGGGAAALNAIRDVPEAMPHYAGGGKAAVAEGILKEGIKAARNIFTPTETKVVRASEALAPHEGKWLNVTQSDRMRSTGGDLGGPGFSRFQTVDPRYAEAQAAWGVGKKPTASAIVNVNKRFPEGQAVWSPMIGSETQHHSNQHVFDMLSDEFNRQSRMGKLTPELRERANQRLQTAPAYKGRFDPNFDIGNPEMLAEAAKTFDRRGALAEVMSGQGVGGQKGSIIDYPGIMQEMTDPMTIGAPTHSIGTRLFELSGGVEHRPDLHSAFPYILQGKDMGVAFNPVPKELALRDWMNQFKEFKGRTPGYYDMTRTVPSQQITEDYLRSLESAGHAEGGVVNMASGGKLKGGLALMPTAQRTDMRQIGQAIDEYAAQDPHGKAKMLYNSPMVQNALLAGSMVNPELAIGVMGRDVLNAAGEGNYGEAALTGGLAALPFMGGITKGVRSVMPRMAGGGDVVKSLIKKTLGAGEGVGSRTIAGSPHTYPPIAEGPWMRDYQPAPRPAPKIEYMGKYTSDPYYKSPEAQQAIMSAMERQRMQYLQRIADPNSPGNTIQDLMQQYPYYEDWMR